MACAISKIFASLLFALSSVNLFFFGRFQPFTVRCSARVSVNSPAGASLAITEPAPMVAPAPIFTGATSTQFEPIEALSSIWVWCLLAPS